MTCQKTQRLHHCISKRTDDYLCYVIHCDTTYRSIIGNEEHPAID